MKDRIIQILETTANYWWKKNGYQRFYRWVISSKILKIEQPISIWTDIRFMESRKSGLVSPVASHRQQLRKMMLVSVNTK